ncbi:hypothetical protein [Pseudoxanthomonas sp. UTMC 1351]|uniref:hypothetical protein n=1 Tax=Pseudoxanthomonas sp. UTMC 1351 TaxID=2695853 RepID=UPI0034CDD8CF
MSRLKNRHALDDHALGQSVLLHTLGTVLGGGCLVQAHLANFRLHRVISLAPGRERR